MQKNIFSIIYHITRKDLITKCITLSLLTSKAIPLLWVSVINPQINYNQVNIFLQKNH
jgi:hypothetical protein